MSTSVPPKVFRVLHAALQGLILKIPKLSEARLASDRTLAFLKAWHYIARAKVEGDYLEFGVFEGLGFRLSLEASAKFRHMTEVAPPRFFAFDSFGGLPAPDSSRDNQVFAQGEYSASRQKFESTIRSARRGREVEIIPGFFDRSLTPELVSKHRLKKAAFVNIDCDLYSSTEEALRFVTPLLQDGTVLYFDDWYFSGGNMTLGEAGACLDWLKANPDIHLVDFGIVGVMGRMFLVNRIQDEGYRKLLPRLT